MSPFIEEIRQHLEQHTSTLRKMKESIGLYCRDHNKDNQHTPSNKSITKIKQPEKTLPQIFNMLVQDHENNEDIEQEIVGNAEDTWTIGNIQNMDISIQM